MRKAGMTTGQIQILVKTKNVLRYSTIKKVAQLHHAVPSAYMIDSSRKYKQGCGFMSKD